MLPATQGVVVMAGGHLQPALLEVAKAYELSVVATPDVDQAYDNILRLQPSVVIVEVPREFREATRLVRRLAASRSLAVIAAATDHSDEMERAVWGAGATCYLPSTESPLVSRTLEAVRGREG